ncbi:MAG TPA: alanine--tRNA ligase [Cyanobacteria bacterium UBA9971]|nr:alanine--tRNA ligase [Cyanobacteria bacterium UBA9971]
MTNIQKISGKEIRQKFINFFKEKHDSVHIQSSSLIPDNPTVLLTTAGMLQFVPIFLGYEAPPNPPRAVTVQKCARAGGKDSDIENVGRTPRHHTFFEMLGNFSFGDYFKKEIIPWAWDFVTNEIGLDKSRLWVTVFETDDESFEIWKNDVGVPVERILRKGKKDNFWGPPGPTGPCGPCTEIHYDLGEEYKCEHPQCGIDTCECDRYVEIWNLVFMELNKDEEENFTPLEKKNVDTGMGLERITMVVNGLTSTFDTDLLQPIVKKVCELSGKKYKDNKKDDVSIRIITDHARCVSFLISDGLIPGNEGRNYVLRMILRRALRHGKILGVELPFLYKIVDTVVENYKDTYPELEKNKEKVISVIKKEEERFSRTIDRGEWLLDNLIKQAGEGLITKIDDVNGLVSVEGESPFSHSPDAKLPPTIISGKDAFKLYDTYGFPFELTKEMAEEEGFSVDEDGFKKAMEEQKVRARGARAAVRLTDDTIYIEIYEKLGATNFVGYSEVESDDSVIKTLIKDGIVSDSLEEGDVAEIILDKTPFYAESGGQVGDTGLIKSENFEAEVLNTTKFNDLFIHKVQIKHGEAKIGEKVSAVVDEARRKDIKIHHTSAHLLQSALREVLGDSVAQAGSQVEPDRTRFDFSFDRAVSEQEVEKVENLINKWINENHKSQTQELSIDEARASGAIALFGEKYGDKVRVVSIEGVSKELCGGTHADTTGEIRLCKVVSESAIAAGTRRIELICGQKAFDYLNSYYKELAKISKKLKTPPTEVTERLEKLQDELNLSQKRIEVLETEIAENKIGTLLGLAVEIQDGKLLVAKVDGIPSKALRGLTEKIGDKLGNSIVVLACVEDEKISITSKVSQNFIAKGVNAGQLVNEIASKCDGKGGGKPNFAQAGAKDVSKLDEALLEVKRKLIL